MTKVNRRKTVVSLLGGASLLVGVPPLLSIVLALPKGCYWILAPYVWTCSPLLETCPQQQGYVSEGTPPKGSFTGVTN